MERFALGADRERMTATTMKDAMLMSEAVPGEGGLLDHLL